MHSITYIFLKLSLPKSQIDAADNAVAAAAVADADAVAAAAAAALLRRRRSRRSHRRSLGQRVEQFTGSSSKSRVATWSGMLQQLLPVMLYIIFIYNKNSSLVLVGSSHKRQKMQENFLFLWRIFHLFLFNFLLLCFVWAIGWRYLSVVDLYM